MKLQELKTEIQKYQYLEDTKIIDVSIASVIANRLKLDSPVWLMIIGASSGGKSQILRPIAQTDERFIHRIDDLTDNTFLSGSRAKEGEQHSLLLRMGNHGIIVISDLTVLMSKSGESKATILSQFRMLYDGEMTKHSGNQKQPLQWKGYLGMVAGATPAIYKHFEEVADMGERFMYYRMKEMDIRKATDLALSRKIHGHELDQKLSDLYAEYIKDVVTSHGDKPIDIDADVKKRITDVAILAEKIRTTASMDWKGEMITNIPVSALPMRTAQQLRAIAKALSVIKYHETGSYKLEENELSSLDWVGYSLANEEKRACLKVLASVEYDVKVTTTTIADKIGLDTSVIRKVLQNLSAVGLLTRAGLGADLSWCIKDKTDYIIVRRIEHISETLTLFNRDITSEEGGSENDNDMLEFVSGAF